MNRSQPSAHSDLEAIVRTVAAERFYPDCPFHRLAMRSHARLRWAEIRACGIQKAPRMVEEWLMSADTPTGSNWSDMLDQIQQSLARILTEIEERQRASNFAAVVASPSEVLAQPAHQPGSEWRRLVTVAANNAAQVEVGLTEADEALQAWLAQAAAVGQALASAGGAGV